MALREKHFQQIHSKFGSSISETYDCGRICSPLNGGEPVCCSTQNAIPVVEKSEWQVLRKKTDLWKKFKPFDAESRKIVEDLAHSSCAIECKGASLCERQHRTLACRSFPFFPYFNKEKEILGITYYWIFEDRCWVISNMKIVEQKFIDELIEAYALVFKHDEDELEAFIEHSASMRRVFSRWKRPIPILGLDGTLYKIAPKSGGKLKSATWDDFPPHEVFASDKNYRKEIEAYGHDPKAATLKPDWSIKDWWNHQ
jgi:hypothetical protein